jgi:hypothetical protein
MERVRSLRPVKMLCESGYVSYPTICTGKTSYPFTKLE